jgi:hypothetical protein
VLATRSGCPGACLTVSPGACDYAPVLSASHCRRMVLVVFAASLAAACSKEAGLCSTCCSNADCESGVCGTFPGGTRLCAERVSGAPTECCVKYSETVEHCDYYYYSKTDVQTNDGVCYQPPDPHGDCTWKEPSGGPVAAVGLPSNNSAVLDGAKIGSVAIDSAETRRVVPVVLDTTIPGLEADQAFILRKTPASTDAYLIIPLRNSGTGYPCGIESGTIAWLGADGAVLKDDGYSAFNGSVATARGNATNLCLAPGEAGYFNSAAIDSDGSGVYANTVSIQIAVIAPDRGVPVAASLVPDRYDIGTCAGSQPTIRVQASAAGGPVSVRVSSGGMISGLLLFLDSDGAPAYSWSHVTTTKTLEVASGETAVFYGDLPSSAPALSRILVFAPLFHPVN